MNLFQKWYYTNHVFPKHRRVAFLLGSIIGAPEPVATHEYQALKKSFIDYNKQALRLNFIPFSFDEILATCDGHKLPDLRNFRTYTEKRKWIFNHDLEISLKKYNKR